MPTKTLKSAEEVKDFVRGCTFFGTGGGGDPGVGLKFLLEDLKEGREIRWVDVSEISENAWTCTPFYMGSIAPLSPEAKEKMKKLGLAEERVKRVLVKAVKELEECNKIKIKAIVPVELGGINTPSPLDTGVRLGIPVVDGDYSGRAVPEVCQATPTFFNKKLTPITCCDQWGNISIIKEAVNYDVGETLGKLISTVAFGLCGEAGFVMNGKDMKEAIIPGTLTKCLNVGKAIREAREKGKDPVEAAVKATEGWLLFKGKVSRRETEDREGYYWGTNTIEGVDEFKNHAFKIWFKNENHASWLDDKPWVTSPDIIEVVQLESAEPITNTDLKENEMVAVIGTKNEKYRTEKGIELLGPKHYGYEIGFVPIENKVKGDV